jgi:hypothetical protein
VELGGEPSQIWKTRGETDEQDRVLGEAVPPDEILRRDAALGRQRSEIDSVLPAIAGGNAEEPAGGLRGHSPAAGGPDLLTEALPSKAQRVEEKEQCTSPGDGVEKPRAVQRDESLTQRDGRAVCFRIREVRVAGQHGAVGEVAQVWDVKRQT